MNTSERLAKWRRKNGYSYATAANVIGISSGVLHKIETGQISITVNSAQRLAKAFGLKKWWVLVTPVDAGR